MYPISFAADRELEGRNRLTTLLRYFIVIPWALVGMLFILAAEVCALIAWFAIVVSGSYPRGLYDFNAKALRMMARVNGLYLLLTDAFPPFHGNPDDAYPVRVDVAPPKPEYSRLKALFRLIVGLPVFLLSYVQNIIASVCAFIAWFTILFTGRVPEGLWKAMRSALAYQTRAAAYFLLMTEDYPPFDYNEAAERGLPAGPPATPLPTQPEEERAEHG